MSETSFDERDRTLGYGRRTYQAACAPGVEITEAQLHAMQRLAVALGLVPNGRKRTRPEKMCALLAQHYASAPGSELAELPRDLRSLVLSMLDDRGARRFALTSVGSATDASASLERRRARYDRLRELLPPLVFWLVDTRALQGWLYGNFVPQIYKPDYAKSERRMNILMHERDAESCHNVSFAYAEWRTYVDDLRREASVDLAGDFRVEALDIESYRAWMDKWVRADLAHPLLMVAVLKALLEAGELMVAESRLADVQAHLDHTTDNWGWPPRRIDKALVDRAREDRPRAIAMAERMLATGKATLDDVVSLHNFMHGWERLDTSVKTPTGSISSNIRSVELRPTFDVWQAVIESVLSGPAASILLGLARQLDTV